MHNPHYNVEHGILSLALFSDATATRSIRANCIIVIIIFKHEATSIILALKSNRMKGSRGRRKELKKNSAVHLMNRKCTYLIQGFREGSADVKMGNFLRVVRLNFTKQTLLALCLRNSLIFAD